MKVSILTLLAWVFLTQASSAQLSAKFPNINAYCTAKTNLVCGEPVLSFQGVPRAGDTSGFTVTSAPARGVKLGLLLYGFTGGTALPFQGGWLCVNTPLRKTCVFSSGGVKNACDGMFTTDWNAYASGASGCLPVPDPALSLPGTMVNLQWYGYDSPNTGPHLSAALEFPM